MYLEEPNGVFLQNKQEAIELHQPPPHNSIQTQFYFSISKQIIGSILQSEAKIKFGYEMKPQCEAANFLSQIRKPFRNSIQVNFHPNELQKQIKIIN